MMEDLLEVYCKDNKCPICSNKLRKNGIVVRMLICDNGCFQIQEYEQHDLSNTCYISVFGKSVAVINTKQLNREYEEGKMYKAINYWKENDRYLAEILSRR